MPPRNGRQGKPAENGSVVTVLLLVAPTKVSRKAVDTEELSDPLEHERLALGGGKVCQDLRRRGPTMKAKIAASPSSENVVHESHQTGARRRHERRAPKAK